MEGNDNQGHPELYDKITRYTAQNYAVIYAVEKDPTRAVLHMRRHDVEVEDLIESRALTIISRDKMYSIERTGLDGHALLNSWHDVMLKVKKASDFKGILAIGSAENFFDPAIDPCKLVKYEGMVGKRFHISFEGICCYSENAVDRLSLGHLVSILNSHFSTIHKDQLYKQWQPTRVLELTHEILAKELDTKTSDLILAAIKRHSGVEKSEIIVDPVLLEDAINAILGKPAADIVFEKIKTAIRQSIRF